MWGAHSVSEIDPRHKHPLHEASHTVGVKEPPKAGNGKVRTGKRPGEKHTFNEASHKLGYWRPEAPSDKEGDAEAVRKRFEALQDTKRDVITDASKAAREKKLEASSPKKNTNSAINSRGRNAKKRGICS